MQVLKEDLRNRILKAAEEEFRGGGYKDASMRRIAAKAGITAGNIYRYYESKQALLQAIIQPAIDAIEKLLRESTGGMIDWQFDADDFLDGRQLTFDLDLLSKGLADISDRYADAMQFISREKEYRSRFQVWLTSVLYVYFTQNSHSQRKAYIRIIACLSADSLIDTISEVMTYKKECQDNDVDFSSVIYRFLNRILVIEEKA